MNALHKRRLYIVIVITIGLSVATGLILYALKQNINVFLTPTQLAANNKMTENYHFRLGGMVKKGSLIRDENGVGASFIVTDLHKETAVHFTGILPDLFREGSGVIAEGHLNSLGIFLASQVLAKHDEHYMPKNIKNSLRENTA